MKIIDKLAWIELKEKHILVSLTKGKDKYYIPGGKREPGETDTEALCREVKEELTVDLKPDTLKFVGIFQAQAHDQPEGVEVKMTCYTGEYTGTLQADSEIEELKWMTNADREKVATVDQLIFDFLVAQGLMM